MDIQKQIEEFIASVDQMPPHMRAIFIGIKEWLNHHKSIISQLEQTLSVKDDTIQTADRIISQQELKLQEYAAKLCLVENDVDFFRRETNAGIKVISKHVEEIAKLKDDTVYWVKECDKARKMMLSAVDRATQAEKELNERKSRNEKDARLLKVWKERAKQADRQEVRARRAERQRDIAVKALEWYADKEKYKLTVPVKGYRKYESVVQIDNSEKAFLILKEIANLSTKGGNTHETR